MKAKIKIIIADDHPVFRRGLRIIIAPENNLEIVGEAENGEIALTLTKSLKPDIIILDIGMPILDGIAAAKAIRDNDSDVRVIFLSMHKDEAILNSLNELKVQGYVLKDSAVMEIVTCINEVINNRNFISPSILELLKPNLENEFNKNKASEIKSNSIISVLSNNELRILAFISESKTNREIAEELYLSIRTVENHRFNICTKLQIRGNHALLKFAIENRESIIDSINNK